MNQSLPLVAMCDGPAGAMAGLWALAHAGMKLPAS